MKIVIYPDIDTDMSIYEQLEADEVAVYSDDDIDTSLTVSSDIDVFNDTTVIILTLNCIVNGKYDITKLEEACAIVSQRLSDNTVVVFDMLVPPRTVHKMTKLLDEFEMFQELNLVYTTNILENTRVLAATTDYSKDIVLPLYEKICDDIRITDTIQTAEAVNIIKNAYKDTLIAFANQTAILSEALTIDLIDAIDLANLDDDINLLYPRPVLENDIIRDSSEIVHLADEYGEASQLSETTRSTNNYVAYHMAYLAEKELYLKEHLAMFETTVCILGITTDEKLANQEDNASLILIDDFVQRDVEVWVHDDKIPEEIIEDHGAKKVSFDEIYDADCIIVMTDTPENRNIDPDKVEKVIITAQPILDKEKFKDKEYSSVGQYRLKKDEML